MNRFLGHRKTEIAFTLIELLVVITIIVVLLALLVPSLDRAIYQAELASCGARQKLVGTAFTTYAMDFNRSYPYRQAVRHPDTSVWPMWMTVPPTPSSVNKSGRGFDDRPMLRPYLSINAFNDPLVAEMDYDSALPEQGAATGTIYWAGWVFKDQGTTATTPTGTTGTGTGFRSRTRGMFRLGDRWTWVDINAPPNAKVFQSTILYGDYMEAGFIFGTGYVYASHPDSDGALSEYVQGAGQTTPYGQANNVLEGMVHSSWRVGTNTPSPEIGTFDMNYARADGSVVRYDRAHSNPALDDSGRFQRVGIAQGATDTSIYYHALPPH